MLRNERTPRAKVCDGVDVQSHTRGSMRRGTCTGVTYFDKLRLPYPSQSWSRHKQAPAALGTDPALPLGRKEAVMTSSHTSLALCILLLAVIGSALSSENREAGDSASTAHAAEEVSVSADDQEVAAVDEAKVEETAKEDILRWKTGSLPRRTPEAHR